MHATAITFRKGILFAISSAALALSPVSMAVAQAVADAKAGDDAELETVVVTGSRIIANGFNAPTPTTVVSAEQLEQTAQPNIFDSIAQLPALQGSAGTANTARNGGTSFGNNGLSSLNLRGLGSNRTLVLLDGQRVVAGHITGITDVSQFPQLLIKRVDVVTGGASASWGSDAVAGVVNFVTDTRFKGIKATLQGGQSKFGDDKSVLAQVAGGTSLMDDRLHVQATGEYFKNDGVPGGNIGGEQPNGRPISFRSGITSYGLTSTPAGSPQFFAFPRDAQNITLARFGLITAGPATLRGLAFNEIGQAYNFAFGSPCIATTCLGGQQDAFLTTNTIDNPLERKVGYGRVGFDITPDVELYGTLTAAQVQTSNTPIAFPRKAANLTIRCTNAYLSSVTLPGSSTTIPQACTNANVTTFTVGTVNANFPARELIETDRQQLRWVVGTKGKFNLGDTPVTFDAYYQKGTNDADVRLSNMTLNGRYNAAIDVIRDTSGNIVCRSTVAQAQGCIPINIFSGSPVTMAQFRWIAPANGPYQINDFQQDVAAASFNLNPFSTWAGEASMAFGLEYRGESYNTLADPYGNGITAATPNSADYPVDGLLNSAGTNWFAGNFKNGHGAFHVREAFLEFALPLARSEQAGNVDLNLGGRLADYSTAGNAKTWKVGATWETPLEGLRLRGVVSRDIRAPNLNDLFTPVTSATQNVTNRATGNNVQVVATGIGNTNLRPEVGKTWEIGAAYQPSFVPGLSVSFDYYDIKLNQAISTLTIQQIVDLCYNGNTAYCSNVKLTGVLGTADFPYVIQQPFNLASLDAKGFDIELGYQIDLGARGKLSLRALATRSLDMISNTGIAGQQIAQLAGNNTEGGAGIPRWKALFSQSWAKGPASLTLTERLISAGYIDPEAIVCTSGCPATTVQNPTYNFNHVPGALYFDLGGNYKIGGGVESYFKVDNLFNHRAPPFGGSSLYDTIGRMYRLGVRFTL